MSILLLLALHCANDLGDPHGMAPGNLMPFAGLTDATQRANLIAYLIALPPRSLAGITPRSYGSRRDGWAAPNIPESRCLTAQG